MPTAKPPRAPSRGMPDADFAELLASAREGAVVQGLGGALYEAIDFAEGRILNPRFSQYRVPRFMDVPAIEPVLLDRRDLPSAVAGETPIVCVAPAIANAVEDAVGVRLTELPFTSERVLAALKRARS